MTVACWPTRRLVGVNFVVSEHTLPLWAKTMDFVQRDANVSATAHAVLGGYPDAEAKATAALAWTRANIRPTPQGFPVVDDHIWHIFVRGYGEPDQRADVFTALLAYSDVPAYWMLIGEPPDQLPLSYVRIGDRWRMYDVTNGLVFRNGAGELATPEELASNPRLVAAAATAAGVDAANYDRYFKNFEPPKAPDVTRADLQMPLRRAWHEARSLIGMQGREWEMRPRRNGIRVEGPDR